jgi:hypothetical protein
VETVRLLIQTNAGALVKKNDYGFAPLHCVCRAYQPRMGIVQALLDACPACIALKTHGGETPVHLACSNSGAFVGVLQLLATAQNKRTGADNTNNNDLLVLSNSDNNKPMTNKVGNTPCKYTVHLSNPSSINHEPQFTKISFHTHLFLLIVSISTP